MEELVGPPAIKGVEREQPFPTSRQTGKRSHLSFLLGNARSTRLASTYGGMRELEASCVSKGGAEGEECTSHLCGLYCPQAACVTARVRLR